VYVDSKHTRWYASSGIFKVGDEVEKDDVVDMGNTGSRSESKLLFQISGTDWKKLYLGDRFIIRDMVASRLLSDEQCIEGVKKILNSYVQTHSLF
jgi:hypothetical protein